MHDALLEAGSTEDKADRATEEFVAFDHRISGVEARLTVLTWMVGTNVTLTILILGSTFAVWSGMGEIAGQVATVSRALH